MWQDDRFWLIGLVMLVALAAVVCSGGDVFPLFAVLPILTCSALSTVLAFASRVHFSLRLAPVEPIVTAAPRRGPFSSILS